MPRPWLRVLACLAAGGMWLVLVMGAAVTNTGSAAGCGRSWPLCNGQFVPEFTVATAIEYSHRAVTGVESLLVVGLAVAMLRLWRGDRETVGLVALMVGTLLLQAGLGAGAVLLPQSPFVLATHFGVSLVCFAATYLSAVVVFERTGGTRSALVPIDRGLRGWTLGAVGYLLVVVYLGAYIRHAEISLACADWPLCNGQLVPALDGPTGFVFAHRVAALGALLWLGWLARLAQRAGQGQRAAAWAAGLAGLQALGGALVVLSRLGLFSTLAHAALAALLFGALVNLARLVLRAPLAAGAGNGWSRAVSPVSDASARTLQPEAGEENTRPHVLATTAFSVAGDSGGGAVADDGRRQRPGSARAADPRERA